MEPRFRIRADGSLNLSDTTDATKLRQAREEKPWIRPMSPEAVVDRAKKEALIQHHGDPANRKHLLGFFEIEFGVDDGQTFKWVIENALGYAGYLVAAMKRDPTGRKDHPHNAHNKGCFMEYMELFPSCRIAIVMKEEQFVEKKFSCHLPSRCHLHSLCHLPALSKAHARPSSTLTHPSLFTEAVAGPSHTLTHPSVFTGLDDSMLLAAAIDMEETHVL
ncbi:Hypothetical protein SMAX5B_015350 [Scophthalmus maximus]|uniref:Uncharacterized protein n=1 Tax=Scophthalmus maximus TaxID=52904 RepID=A0A2U9C7W7_SCOMX|nr:Hypothetical protein SMAX5B_015350 [Scophthalmus maximus]